MHKKLQSWLKRLPRLEAQIAQAERTIGTHQSQLHEQMTGLMQLFAWQTQLQKENQTNPNPPAYVEARMDAGFASGENLTWLLEMGYCPNTKTPNGQTAPPCVLTYPITVTGSKSVRTQRCWAGVSTTCMAVPIL